MYWKESNHFSPLKQLLSCTIHEIASEFAIIFVLKFLIWGIRLVPYLRAYIFLRTLISNSILKNIVFKWETLLTLDKKCSTFDLFLPSNSSQFICMSWNITFLSLRLIRFPSRLHPECKLDPSFHPLCCPDTLKHLFPHD